MKILTLAFFISFSVFGSNLPTIGRVEKAIIYIGDESVEVEVKIDSGAKTSSLSAQNIVEIEKDKKKYVRFNFPGNSKIIELPIVKKGNVKSSRGLPENSIFVAGEICLKSLRAKILFTLNDRSNMTYPVLIGREFLNNKYLIDVGQKKILKNPKCH